MKRTRSLFLSLAGSAGFAALAAAACGSDYEVNDDFCRRNPNHPECPPAGLAGASGASGTAGQGPAGQGPGGSGSGNAGASGSAGVSGSGGSGGGTSGTGGSGPLPTACDPAEQPDDAKGVFVDASAPPGGKGTRAEPFASLPSALAALANLPSAAGATLYLRQGAAPYELNAPLALPPLVQGVGLVLDGGWNDTWQRDCSDGAASKTVVRGKTAAVSPVLSASGGSLTLRRLTVQTADVTETPSESQPGTSLIAMLVSGTTNLLADTAALRAGKAGDGGAAAPAAPVNGARACNGLTDCGSGAPATTPGPSGGTNMVTLTSTGFVPGDGQDGQTGTGGENGTRNATSNGKEDSACVSCAGTTQAACELPGNLPGDDQTSADGKCGCGGLGGTPGRGGKGGGASVALWIGSPAVRANLFGTQIVSGNGGQGSVGGKAAGGSSGTNGVPGQTTCRVDTAGTECVWSSAKAACLPDPFVPATNPLVGVAGGRGGNGSPGGPGGPGTGGPSYALVSPTGAAVQIDATSTLTAGQGGLGGDGVTIAEAAPQKTY